MAAFGLIAGSWILEASKTLISSVAARHGSVRIAGAALVQNIQNRVTRHTLVYLLLSECWCVTGQSGAQQQVGNPDR